MSNGDGGFVELGGPGDLVYVNPDRVLYLGELEDGGTILRFGTVHSVSVPQPPGEVLTRFEEVG